MLNILSGICCIISTVFLLKYPMFSSPKGAVERKMGKQDWKNINSFQRRIKNEEKESKLKKQLEEIEREKSKLMKGSKKKSKKKPKKQQIKSRKRNHKSKKLKR